MMPVMPSNPASSTSSSGSTTAAPSATPSTKAPRVSAAEKEQTYKRAETAFAKNVAKKK
jgi:hypothetical protein